MKKWNLIKWNLIIDVDKCTNCNVCAVAVQDEHVGNQFPGYAEEMPKHGHRWIEIMRRERGTGTAMDVAYLPTLCQHCDNAPCIKKAPDAIQKRADGIVLIDPVKAKGRKDLVEACPYGAIWWNAEKQIPQHWIFDAHLLDRGWKEPRCVTVCATNAMTSVKVDDAHMARLVDEQGLQVRLADAKTKPRVYYKNLWRYETCFIAGTVSCLRDGQIECLAGAEVRLLSDGDVIETQKSDVFGDFKFDKLAGQSTHFKVIVDADGQTQMVDNINLDQSINIGEIHFA